MSPDEHDWQPRDGRWPEHIRWECSRCKAVSTKIKQPRGILKRLYWDFKEFGKISCGQYLAIQVHDE